MHRPVLYFALAMLCALAATFTHDASQSDRLTEVAARMQADINTASDDLDRIASRALAISDADSARAWHAMSVFGDSIRPFGMSVSVRARGIHYWTSAGPMDTLPLDASAHARFADGTYLRAWSITKWGHARALRRVWFQPPFENRYLHRGFDPSLHVPEGVEAANDAGLGPVVRDAAGQVMFRLHWHDGPVPPGTRAQFRLSLILLALAFLIASVWSIGMRYVSRGWPLRTSIMFIAIVVTLRVLTLANGPWSAFNASALFDPALFASSFIMPSLGDLLINAALLLFACAFVRGATRNIVINANGGTIIFPLALMLGLGEGITVTMTALVRDSRIPLDLFQAQSLDYHSLVALLAMAGMLLAWLCLADACVRPFARAQRVRRLALCALIVFLASYVVHYRMGQYDSVFVLWPLPPLIVLFSSRRTGPRPMHALLLTALFALFSVHLLNRQAIKRTESERVALAENMGAQDDPAIVPLFREAANDMLHDRAAMGLLNDTSSLPVKDLDARLRRPFFSGAWEDYDVRLHLFAANGVLKGSTSPGDRTSRASLDARFEKGAPVEEDSTLRRVRSPTEEALYIGAIGRLFVEVRPRLLPEGIGFPELLLAGDRSVDRRIGRFARARYDHGALVENEGGSIFPLRWKRAVPRDGLRYTEGGFAFFAAGDESGSVAVVGSRIPRWIDHITTFSYVFVLFAFVALLVFAAVTLARGERIAATGLGIRLRAGILVFAGLAFTLFAYGAQRLLRSHYARHTAEQVDERSLSAIAELRQRTRAEAALSPAMYRDLDHSTDIASNALRTDITLYSTAGNEIATSREQVFTSGLLGTRMDPAAYTALAIDGLGSFAHEERIGDAVFRTAYRPLINDRGTVLAYLAVPYFARQSEVEAERAEGYVAIVNLLVLLFVMSVVAAAVITNWSTRPLQLLRRGLERIGLGARNEPIVYQGNDELGELVRVYNRKVDELRESAEKLARSERESAWKEMAKQVAHEIKNPLTPMKLGIQHFQRSWDPNASDAKQKLDRFSASMVEQIDALSRVASDFSQFAQMSAANETTLDLNDVAKSAVELFRGEPNADIILHSSAPQMVKADREHLLRVFNNLIKNALQSIPEGRRGKIDIVLRSEGNEAIAEVRDNGSGIPEEARERIFAPSFTTKTSGMGLGLAMAKRMVEQAGGKVWFITSTALGVTGPKEGTTFFVALPHVQ